jgi:hypothetical protein
VTALIKEYDFNVNEWDFKSKSMVRLLKETYRSDLKADTYSVEILNSKSEIEKIKAYKLWFQRDASFVQRSMDIFNEEVDRTNGKTKCAGLVKKSEEIVDEINLIYMATNFRIPFTRWRPLTIIPYLEKLLIQLSWLLIVILNVITVVSYNIILPTEI